MEESYEICALLYQINNHNRLFYRGQGSFEIFSSIYHFLPFLNAIGTRNHQYLPMSSLLLPPPPLLFSSLSI